MLTRRLSLGRRLVDHALGNHEDVTGGQPRRITPIFKLDLHVAVDHMEQLVFVGAILPQNLALDLADRHQLVIDAADHRGGPERGDFRQGGHDSHRRHLASLVIDGSDVAAAHPGVTNRMPS